MEQSHDQLSLQHDQQIHQSEKEKRTYQRTRNQIHHGQTHHRANLIHQMIATTINPKERNVILKKALETQAGLGRLTVERLWLA